MNEIIYDMYQVHVTYEQNKRYCCMGLLTASHSCYNCGLFAFAYLLIVLLFFLCCVICSMYLCHHFIVSKLFV